MNEKKYCMVILPLKLDWVPCYGIPEGEVVKKGDWVRVRFAGKEYVGIVGETDVAPQTDPLKIKDLEAIERTHGQISPDEIKLWAMVAGYYLCSIGEVFKAAYPALKISERPARRRKKELAEVGIDVSHPIGLSGEQEAVYQEIIKEDPRPVLLRGVAGSGKTEIYLKAARKCIDEGKNVLYLVPEIAMSRQLKERITKAFGTLVLTYHSAEGQASRRNTAEKIRTNGTPYLLLGTRSALFLPHQNLGLIIVDEEHDTSYKQDSPAPRYHGRDVAIMLSTLHHAKVILGSATPSLESVFNCQCGKYRLLSLDSRYYDSQEAEVEVIDIGAERRKNGMIGSFSRKLIDRMKKTLEDGGQILILRGRHSPTQTLNVEEEAQALFPAAKIVRIDSDTPKKTITETIKDFDKGKIDILSGTQIITKGFDFPKLALTVVINADSLLGLQDFRADEKAAQTLIQLKGRSGRRTGRGCLTVQTYKPEHPVYQHLSGKRTEAFYTGLLAERRNFDLPPYTRLIKLTVKDSNEPRIDKMSGKLSAALRRSLSLEEAVCEPCHPPVDKVSDKYIREISVTLKKDRKLKMMKLRLAETVAWFEKNYRYPSHITIDVDPA